jgi:hypothetical protein
MLTIASTAVTREQVRTAFRRTPDVRLHERYHTMLSAILAPLLQGVIDGLPWPRSKATCSTHSQCALRQIALEIPAFGKAFWSPSRFAPGYTMLDQVGRRGSGPLS